MNYPYQLQSAEAYRAAYQKSIQDPEGFWADIADNFTWQKKWDKVLDWNFKEPKIEWFKGGQLNITENCLDRHLATRGNEPAIIWESNDPNEQHRVLTYQELHFKVQQFANVLLNNGVQKGDRVCIYMGMIPELAIATLACARIGAIHSVIFGGFSAQAIADRLDDAGAEFIVTCDGAYRGAKDIALKSVIDDALVGNKTIKRVIVCSRTRTLVSMSKGRDVWWEDEIKKVETMGNPKVEAAAMDAEDILFILYTSGSTGKPKGVVHTTAGYMVWTNYTFVNTFQYQPGQVHFCTADIGWITGHSYIIYGPLSAGAATLMFEGVPTWPDAGRLWDVVEKFKVDILYTAPTAIRSLMACGLEPIKGKDLSSLKVLGSVGEPINEEAWHWYNEHIGQNRCPIVDTWWQTETGGVMISNLAGITPAKPSYATLPLPGIQPCLVDENGVEIEGNGVNGNLCIKFPWPGMIRSTYKDHERCRQTYFSTYEDLYFTGDGCIRDEEGMYRITGRVDDVLNVSGHRIGTAEVENAINMHASVHINGILDIAKPDQILFVSSLPKTRSGKIMRRILRKIAEGDISNLGDTSTLLDPSVVDQIVKLARH